MIFDFVCEFLLRKCFKLLIKKIEREREREREIKEMGVLRVYYFFLFFFNNYIVDE